MNRDEILEAMMEYLIAGTGATENDAFATASDILEFLEDIGFDAEASAIEAGRLEAIID